MKKFLSIVLLSALTLCANAQSSLSVSWDDTLVPGAKDEVISINMANADDSWYTETVITVPEGITIQDDGWSEGSAITVVGKKGTSFTCVLSGSKKSATEAKVVLYSGTKKAIENGEVIRIWVDVADNFKGGDITLTNTKFNATTEYSVADQTFSVPGPTTGINSVESNDVKVNGACYNVAGQRVNANAKGIIISNGKKIMVK